MQGFIFGGDTGETPESIARKRKIADAMYRANSAPKNVGEGLSAIGNALAAKYMQRKASEAEAKGRDEATAAFEAALMGGGGIPGVGSYTPKPGDQVGTPFMPVGVESIPSGGAVRPAEGGSFIDRIIQAESAGDPSAVSPKGAGGLMQIMPDTARDPGYGVPNIYETAQQFGLTPPSPDATDEEMTAWLADPANVEANRTFGTNYANAMQAKFGEGTPEAAAAYNAGPGAVEKFGGVPPYAETQGYVQKVAGNWSPEMAQAAIDRGATAPDQWTPQMAGQVMQGGATSPGMQQGIQISPQLVQALSNPWMSDAQKSVLAALVQKQLGPGKEAPSSVQEFQYAQSNGFGGSYTDFLRMKKAGTNVNVNTGGIQMPGDDKFANKAGEYTATMLGDMAKAGVDARGELAQIGELGGLLEQGLGGTADAWKLWAQNSLGINLGAGGAAEAFSALINRLVPQQRPPGSGQMSDRDVELFKQSLPQLINSPEGNRLILDTMQAMAEFKRQQGEIARQVLVGRMSRQDGLDALYSLPDPLQAFRERRDAMKQTDTSAQDEADRRELDKLLNGGD